MPYTKPLPKITFEDQPFWEGTRQRRLLLPRCRQCGHVWFPPYARCPRCLSPDLAWVQASGKGKVWGLIEMVQPYIPAFKDDIPYNVVLVELEEGPKMFSNLVGVRNDAIRVDTLLQAVFEDVTDEVTLVKFRPA